MVHDQKDLHGGITPAYAGKSDFHDAHLRFFEDHPRLCGEKVQGVWQCLSIKGSPPPMRGKAKLAVESSACCRITPAYAGKRRPCGDLAAHCRDHPRLCGEKAKNPVQYSCKLGSPPPMRGKVGNGLKSNFIHGITPAYAGKSSPFRKNAA